MVLFCAALLSAAEDKAPPDTPIPVAQALEAHRQESRQIRSVMRDGLIESKRRLIGRLEAAMQELRSSPPQQEALRQRIEAEREKLGRLLNPAAPEQVADDDRVRWVNENYPDGKLRSRTPYVGRQIHGVREELDNQGVVRARLSYREGQLHGLCEYFAGDGKPSSEKSYLNGVPDGLERVFHAGHYRRVQIERFWREGRLHGEEKEFDRSTNLIRRTFHAVGSRHGVEEFYHPQPGGQPPRLVRQVFWEWGQNQGQIEHEYDAAGGHLTARLRRDAQLRLSGVSRYYRADGSLEKEAHYRDDQPDGLVEYFSRSGQVIGRELWQAGRRAEEIIPLPKELR